MKTALSWLKTFCSFVVVALLASGCSSSGSNKGAGGNGASTGGQAGASAAGAAGTAGASTGGAAGTGGANTGGAGTGNDFVYFVKQANGATTATLANGTISVSSAYGTSGNAFKYVAPNYYGTVSNGFIAFPTPMTGDFSITAEVTVTTQNKANTACGIGLGMTTGFAGTDAYGYVLMRNSSNVTTGLYVSSASSVSAGAPAVSFTNGTPLQLSFSRTGGSLTYGAGPVGGTATKQTTPASAFTNGTTAYGAGSVYPAISFNNVVATIAKLVIKDATGATVFDSATGSLVPYIPASLTLSASTVYVDKGSSAPVTATAVALGGAVSAVTAVPADPTIVIADVTNGATNSSITLNGLKSGVTTVTVTNSGDSNSATNNKPILVSVADYPASDNYGSLATVAYPAPGATSAYTDGELALTFDAPPTLNAGGTLRIYDKSSGTEVDRVSFADEANVYGTTTINVGSQLARVSGNTVYFAPHVGKLAYGTAYYVVVPMGAITGTLNGVAFDGLSNSNTVATWNFTTRAAPTLTASNVTVDGSQNSTADFRTIEGALGSLATLLPTAADVTIHVAAGTYNELVYYVGPGTTMTQTVNILGPTGNDHGDTCIVQFANGNGMNASTRTRASFYVSGANLVLENITVKNTALRSAVGQAESLYFGSGTGFHVAAHNSTFSSNQDTIQTSGQAWFFDCAIEGNVDFIWGTADAALFENSSLHFVNDTGGAATFGLIVARTGATIPAGTSGTVGKGFVVFNSTVSVDANVTAYFGRDAGTGSFYDQAALVNVTFTGAGAIGAGLWNVNTAPLSLGNSSYVGWKSAGCTGLNLATLTTSPMTSATIASQATEYDTRDHILNRVVTITSGAPSGYQAVTTPWDVSSLATAWGAP